MSGQTASAAALAAKSAASGHTGSVLRCSCPARAATSKASTASDTRKSRIWM